MPCSTSSASVVEYWLISGFAMKRKPANKPRKRKEKRKTSPYIVFGVDRVEQSHRWWNIASFISKSLLSEKSSSVLTIEPLGIRKAIKLCSMLGIEIFVVNASFNIHVWDLQEDWKIFAEIRPYDRAWSLLGILGFSAKSSKLMLSVGIPVHSCTMTEVSQTKLSPPHFRSSDSAYWDCLELSDSFLFVCFWYTSKYPLTPVHCAVRVRI